MFGRNKTDPVPSDAQAREKLTVYVYEYLHHVGATNAATLFLKEIQWEKGHITPNDHPGFLHSWWCVFWDLYCAAPERRDSFPHSKQASAFHDYALMSGYPLSPNMNGMGVGVGMPGQAPPHHPHNMGEGGPGSVPSPSLHQLGPPNAMTDGGMPPGYFPGSHLRPSPSQMMAHGSMSMMAASQPSPLQQHPGHPGQGPQQHQQNQQQQHQANQGVGPPTPGSAHMQSNGPMSMNPNSPHAHTHAHGGISMMMQPGNNPFGHGPRGYAPSSNRSSPATRMPMPHPGQQQMEFGPPPGSILMNDGPQGMMMSRGGRGGMPPSPMPPGAYGGPGPGGGGGGGGMQRMQHNPGGMPGMGGSPSANVNMMSMPSMHLQRQPWQQQHPGGGHMGHYSTPSPPNGPSPYMNMMGPPTHMQSPSQESVLSGGSESIYGMMKATDRFGNNMTDTNSMANMVNVEMASSMNGNGIELKHSPGMNSNNDTSGGRSLNSNMDNVVDDYGLNQFSAAAAAAAASSAAAAANSQVQGQD